MALEPTPANLRTATKEPTRDASMTVRAAIGQQLISRETALAICRMVILDWEGEVEYRAQQPLVAEDGLNVWKIRGGLVRKPDAVPGDPTPIEMSISKFDGAIVSLAGSACRVAPGRRAIRPPNNFRGTRRFERLADARRTLSPVELSSDVLAFDRRAFGGAGDDRRMGGTAMRDPGPKGGLLGRGARPTASPFPIIILTAPGRGMRYRYFWPRQPE